MALYSFNNAYPASLPKSHLAPDGTNYTALNELPDAKLASLGYVAAPDAPIYDADTHKLAWNGSAWVLTALDAGELAARLSVKKADKKAAATEEFRSRVGSGISLDLGSGPIPIATSHDAERELDIAAGTLGGATINVVTRAGDVISLNAANAATVRNAIRTHRRACQENETTLYKAINAAVDHDGVNAVDTSSGWPSTGE